MDVTGTYYQNDTDIGYGTELLVGQGTSPETWAAVKGVVEIKLGKLTAEKIRRTHLRSPNRAHEYTTGLADYDAISVKVNWDPNHGSQNAAGGTDGFLAGRGLLGLNISQVTANFKAVLQINASPFEWPFSGKVMGFDPPAINNEGLLEATFEIQPVSDYRGDLP
ncbi:MAG: phage tail tube protein [Vicinamibacterales bacterium]